MSCLRRDPDSPILGANELTYFFRIDDWRLLKSQTELDLCNLTVGELLKKKAEDGVRVLLMIWGETTSIMGTHDAETENFFKGRLSLPLDIGKNIKHFREI